MTDEDRIDDSPRRAAVAQRLAPDSRSVLMLGAGLALTMLAFVVAWFGGKGVLLAMVVAGVAGWMLAKAHNIVRSPGATIDAALNPADATQGGIGAAAPGGTAPEAATPTAPCPDTGSPRPPTRNDGRQGAEVMVRSVVPMWSRQLETTRDVADRGLARLLEAFSGMVGSLDTLGRQISESTVGAEPGAVHAAVGRAGPALQALLAPSRRAFEQRDAMVAELARCSDGLHHLQELAKQARELAHLTRLAAFNASIESQRERGGAGGAAAAAAASGTQSVAAEVRLLADRMGQTGEQIEQVVLALASSAQDKSRCAEIDDTTLEVLQIEIDFRAREALAALLGSLGPSLPQSGEVREAAEALRAQLDETFVGFQFGDRISQMLAIVGNDMIQFERWVAAHPTATQSDAAKWLAALEASYTMDEQRSKHHGNVHVERSSEIEFF